MSASVQVASGLTLTIPRPTSRCAIGAFVRVGDSTRRNPVIHACLPRRARARGSTLRIAQHSSGSVCHRSSRDTSGCITVRFRSYRSRTRSTYQSVSAKWYCVSRKTTSMPGAALAARSTRTQSWNDAASTTSVPKRSHAHLMALDAGLRSSSADIAASSARSTSTNGRSTITGSRRLMVARSPHSLLARSRRSCRRALPVADFGDVGTGLVVVDVELGGDVGAGELVEVGEGPAHGLGTTGARQPRLEHLAGLALLVEAPDDPHDRLGRGLGRDLGGLVAELDLGLAQVPSEEHLVSGCGAPVCAALQPEEADVGDVMLATAVRAARDVHAHAGNLGQARILERIADRGGQTARLRDREVAGVGARARDDVAGELGARFRHPDVVQPVVQRSYVGLTQVAQREVLTVGDADVEPEVALDVGE